ncbi:MAG: fumarylacetoacetate hydrolase family protein [Pseudomonadales bacterium]
MQHINWKDQRIAPSKIVCVGRNYHEHIAELNNDVPENMVLFIKPNSAIAQQLIATQGEPIHYEAELCFLLRDGKFAAVAAGLDLTKRETQSKLKAKGLPWERAKAFDNSAVFSDFVDLPGDSSALRIQLDADGEPLQDGHCAHMIYSPQEILREIQQFCSLEDGDIVMTGTPKGVGTLCEGKRYSARVLDGEQTLIEHHWQAV